MIELKNLSSGYGKQPVLQNVSARFAEGKLTAVIGPNGCGKSTLFKTMIRLLPIASGDILINGKSLKQMNQAQTARALAYLSQNVNHTHLTVGELVLHGRFAHTRFPRIYTARDRAAAEEAMARMGISDLAPCALSSLSGGMRQSAYIAMALSQGSDHILLDEPTAHLDIAHRISLLKNLRTLAKQGKCVVAILHDLPLAMAYADELAVMQNGKLLMQDTPENVFSSHVIGRVFGAPLCRFAQNEGYIYYFNDTP